MISQIQQRKHYPDWSIVLGYDKIESVMTDPNICSMMKIMEVGLWVGKDMKVGVIQ